MAQLLHDEFGWNAIDEVKAENPYLANFYADMPRWALHLQVYFLTKRFKSVQRAMWSENVVVQDRTIYEDAYVFVENLFHMHLIPKPDYDMYQELFQMLNAFVNPPQLLIYLKASVPSLVSHIRQRGNAYEVNISYEYLAMLNARYDEWIDSYKNNIITVNVDDIDFVKNPQDREKVIRIIQNHLPPSLFSIH